MNDPIIEENLKKLLLSFAGNFYFLPFSSIRDMTSEHLKKFTVSEDHLEFDTDFDMRDMAWNHMDFTHRPWIHKHYTDGLRTVLGKDISLGFTPWARTPFLIPTFDIRVSEREFLHGYNLAGLFYVFVKIQIIESSTGGNRWSLNWFILSNKFLRFFHSFLHRSMKKMNKKLFEEDRPVKNHRKDLRKRGYTFVNDTPDYYASTILFPNNVRRPSGPELTILLSDIVVGSQKIYKSSEREFLVHRTAEDHFEIWDNICPHQGARLSNGQICDGFATCPWHGLRFSAMVVSTKQPSREHTLFSVRLENKELKIMPKN